MNRKGLVRGIIALTVAGALLAVATTTRAASRAAAVQDDASAEALIDDWIAAIGGLEVYWPMSSARFTLTTEMYDADSGRLRRTRPRYVTIARTPLGELTRIERWEGDNLIAQGWDGRTAWATMNGEFLAAGDMDYDQVQYVSGDVNYWISLPYKLKDDGVNLHHRGRDEEGRQVVGVTFGDGIGLHDGDTWQYWFEDGKTWPVQVAYMEEGRTAFSKLRFEDIRTVGGYVFVGRRVHTNADGNVWKVLKTSDFELNPAPSLEIFSTR